MTTELQCADEDIGRLLDLLTRRERGRLIAGLVNRIGHHNLELAEDVAQDALLSALSVWQYQGTPDNPAAWLTRVAHNKALDRLRHENRNQPLDDGFDVRNENAAELDAERITDPELRLVFLSCHRELDSISQLALTLRIVCGFTAREIAEIFLSTESAIAQRLSRSKRKIRRLNRSLVEPPTVFEIESRLDAVLKVVYLIFSLGYAPRSGASLIRRDVAMEAVRLARELADEKHTSRTEARALAALLCFQASRLDAREDECGLPVLLPNQDRKRWDRNLVSAGVSYLRGAMQGRQVSRYHLEAGIASIYATAPSWERVEWRTVLDYYDRLERLTDSPVVVVNACVARALAGEAEESLGRLNSIADNPLMASYAPFHIARAEILRMLGRDDAAKDSFRLATQSQASQPVIEYLEQRVVGNV